MKAKVRMEFWIKKTVFVKNLGLGDGGVDF
jgi:hypothetical protein